MLIKIRTSNTADSWEIIDNVSNVTYSGNLTIESSEHYIKQLRAIGLHDRMAIYTYGEVPDPYFFISFEGNNKPLDAPLESEQDLIDTRRFAWIRYYDNHMEETRTILHNTMAYICTDDGKTIHKSVIEPQLTTIGVPA